MARLLGIAGSIFIALAPMAALAASPSPSPSLDSIIAKPPSSDYTQLTTGTFHGEFTANDWAANSTGASASETVATLNRNGFVQGYGLVWASTAQRRALVEIVMAFTGGQGARRTLTALEATEKNDPHYQHADTLAGVDPSYGAHLYDSSNAVYEDGFSFVKGNDLFQVYFGSVKDDNLAPATTQAKNQYAAAPDSTIPSSQWPENAHPSTSPASTAGQVFAFLLVAALVLGVIGVVVGLILRGRRRPMAPVYGAPVATGVQMSPDGNHWYDGQTWRDAAVEVPPTAQRSSDGTLWWDGRTWRPVPQPPAS